jgi:hypothetical protein
MKPLFAKILLHSLIIFLGLIWILASYYKIVNPVEFYRNILEYKLISGNLAAWIALWFPFFELLLGIALILHFHVREFLIISMIVFAFFSILILITILRGLDIGCGCFSTNDYEPIGFALGRDLLFLFVNVAACTLYEKLS